MTSMENFDEQFKNLTEQLEELVSIQNKAYSSLDKETHEKVKQYQIDTNTMLREFQKGNFDSISDLINKYTKADAGNIRK